jgi:hypothetical protein
MACLNNPISQHSLNISPIWIPLSAMRSATHREDQYDLTDSPWASTRFLSRFIIIYSTDGASGTHIMVSQYSLDNPMY